MKAATKLGRFIGEGRGPHESLDRLREEGLLRLSADEKKVFSILVDAFMEELNKKIIIIKDEKARLRRKKKDFPTEREEEYFDVRPWETRAHILLGRGLLEPFLSHKGLVWMRTLAD